MVGGTSAGAQSVEFTFVVPPGRGGQGAGFGAFGVCVVRRSRSWRRRWVKVSKSRLYKISSEGATYDFGKCREGS